MTAGVRPAVAEADEGRRPGLALHVIALAIVLSGLVAAGLPGVPYFVDEGGLWLQLDARLDGEWGIPYEFAADDPDWRFRPLARASRTDAGMAQYLRHPLHVAIATPFMAVGSHWGLLALSIASVVAVAGLSAAVACRIRPGSAGAAFWIVGLASPLAFHAHLWIGHPLAAVGSAVALWGVVRFLDRGDARWLVTVALGVAFAAAIRSEGLFVGPALAGGFGLLWLLRRIPFGRALPGALAAAVPPVLVWFAERSFVDAITGTVSPTVQLSSRSSALLGSVEAAFLTLMSSSYADYLVGWLLVAVPLVVYAAAKRSGSVRDGRPLAVALASAAVLFGIRLFLGDVFPVPGILVAFPLGVAALALLEREDTEPPEILLPLLAASLVAVGVLATQYEDGGGFEWGWRYFAVGIPFLAPALAVAVDHIRAWDGRRWLVTSAAALTVVMLAVQVFTVRELHGLHRGFVEDLAAFSADQELGERPLVVAIGNGLALVPGLFASEYDRYSWLSAEGGTVEEVGRFLAETSTEEFVALRPSGRSLQPGPPWQLIAEMPGSPFDLSVYRR